MDQHVKGLAPRRARCPARYRPGRRRSRSGRGRVRPADRWPRTPPAGRVRRRSCGAAGDRSVVQPEVEHHARAGRFVLRRRFEPSAAGLPPSRSRCVRTLSALETTASSGIDSPVLGFDPRTRPSRSVRIARTALRCSGELDSQFPGEPGQGTRPRRGASSRIPDPLAGLHVGNAAQHRGREVGRRPDVLGEVIEHLGDPGIGHVARTVAPDLLQGRRRRTSESMEGRRRGWVEHVADRRPAARKKNDEICHAGGSKGRGSGDSPGAWPLGANESRAARHLFGVGVQVKGRAVVEERPPLGVEGDQFESS